MQEVTLLAECQHICASNAAFFTQYWQSLQRLPMTGAPVKLLLESVSVEMLVQLERPAGKVPCRLFWSARSNYEMVLSLGSKYARKMRFALQQGMAGWIDSWTVASHNTSMKC